MQAAEALPLHQCAARSVPLSQRIAFPAVCIVYTFSGAYRGDKNGERLSGAGRLEFCVLRLRLDQWQRNLLSVLGFGALPCVGVHVLTEVAVFLFPTRRARSSSRTARVLWWVRFIRGGPPPIPLKNTLLGLLSVQVALDIVRCRHRFCLVAFPCEFCLHASYRIAVSGSSP